jgi:hypothetical protein
MDPYIEHPEVWSDFSAHIVTTIVLLSPMLKTATHPAYDTYQQNRQGLQYVQTHLLEIDLLRGGKRLLSEQPATEAPYYVTLSRANRRPYVEVWPIQLSAVLPVLPVPLLAPDPDVPLDLGAAVAACYERGGYDVIIDYTRQTPPPKFSKDEELWIDQRLREKGLR